MKQYPDPSRRNFIGKVVTGAVSLAAAQHIGGAWSAVAGVTKKRHPDALLRMEHKFVPVMLTPYKADLSIDFDALSRLIDFYREAGAKGFFANCLSSEMYDLDDEERIALVSHVVKRVDGKLPVVATGSFGADIEARAAYTKRMYDTGVNAVILITSHFAGKDEPDSVLIENLDRYLSLTENIPLGTYECPSPYKRILSPEVLKYLLATNRLIYHKDTCLDLKQIRVKLDIAQGSKLEFYDAHTPNALHSMQMGAKGMSCIAGNFYPEIFAWMCRYIDDPEKQEALLWLQSELTRMDRIISQGYSLSAKHFLNMRGVPMEVNSRRKKTSLSDEQKRTLEDVYRQLMGWHRRLGI